MEPKPNRPSNGSGEAVCGNEPFWAALLCSVPAAAALLWLAFWSLAALVVVLAWPAFTSAALFAVVVLALWSAVVVDGVVAAADWSAVVLLAAGAAAVVEPAFTSEVLDEDAVVVFELVLGAAAAAFWSAVPVVLVVLLAEGVAEVELALEPIALWSAVVVEAEVEGAAAVLLAGAADAEVAL